MICEKCREKENREEWVLEITIDSMNEYAKYYFKEHPRARNHPLKTSSKVKNLTPYPVSINMLTSMVRVQQNSLKQKWSDYIVWLCKKNGYDGLMLEGVEMYVEFYFNDKRKRDIIDNYNLKFINDGLVRAGFLAEDDYTVIPYGHYMFKGFDKNNPRTVIRIVKIHEDYLGEAKD